MEKSFVAVLVIVLFLIALAYYTREPLYTATVFDSGDVAVDGNRCTVEAADGFRIIRCK